MHPLDYWDQETTRELVEYEWALLRDQLSWSSDGYDTAACILNDARRATSRTPVRQLADGRTIYLEAPSPIGLRAFYADNGLSLVPENRLASIGAIEKLGDALDFVGAVPSLVGCVGLLVRVIGVLKSPGFDEDVSYSHPAVPFTVFVSVCNERSTEASARVAESVLHEAMHLRLSLIQKAVELLVPEKRSARQCFSPWRKERRPAEGVLHGLFVFRAILEFFRILSSRSSDTQIIDYSARRIRDISAELAQVRDFHESPALTYTGSSLARQLAQT